MITNLRSYFQSLPVGMLKIAQKPTIRIPSALITTARSTEVGPKTILNKQIAKQIIRMKKQRAKNDDCQPSKDGIG